MLAISEIERFRRRNSSSFISIAISLSRVPPRRAKDTEGREINSSRTRSAAERSPSSDMTVDETESVNISADTLASLTVGESAETGGKFSMAPIAFLTSERTASASAVTSSSASSLPTPSDAMLTTLATPASPTMLSSMRRLMSSSTSLGEDPGAATETLIVLRSNSGRSRTFRLSPPMMPPRIRNTIRSFAATGLPTKYAITPLFMIASSRVNCVRESKFRAV